MFQAPRGTQDILPGEQSYWQFIRKAAAEVAALYGYDRIDTPVFEDSGLFVRTQERLDIREIVGEKLMREVIFN